MNQRQPRRNKKHNQLGRKSGKERQNYTFTRYIVSTRRAQGESNADKTKKKGGINEKTANTAVKGGYKQSQQWTKSEEGRTNAREKTTK